MQMRGRLRQGVALAVGLLLAVAPTAAAQSAGPPTDYTKVEGLSEATFGELQRDALRVPMGDGTELYVEVVRPKAEGRYPVILEASPYHGTLADRDGTRILPDPQDGEGNPLGLTRYFGPRGYAVVMVDLRGTGRSQGCLDHLGQNDGSDLKRIIEWAAGQQWSNGRVGMTGHSYVGSTPPVAAAQRPEGLATIVPSAGLARMYDHQFQAGVPYFLQWAGPIEAYEQLAIERHLPPLPIDPFGLANPGDNFGNDMEYFGCGLPNSAATAGEKQLSGEEADWHRERDHTEGATRAEIPVFLIHGVNDNAARVDSMDWFTQRNGRPGDKLWLGQWDHGSGCCPNRRGIQWTKALHAWFDKHLAGREVDTGPPVEVFLADSTFDEATTGARTEIHTAGAWPGSPRTLELHPTEDGKLGEPAAGTGSTSFTGDPSGFADPQATGGATFSTEPMERDTLLAGVPQLDLSASVSAPRVHLIANVYDENAEGERRRLSQCAINPELREGIDQYQPVSPGERYDMKPPCFAIAHDLQAGHKLVLRVTTSDPDKVPMFSVDPQVTVFTGDGATELRLPVVENRDLFPDDLPLEEDDGTPPGEAQAGVNGAVTPTAAGAGVRAGDLTSAFFEFDAKEGFDNARAVVKATPGSPSDIDLYLQRRLPDGTWSEDIAAGETSSLENETLESGRLKPGRYRVEVHSYLGAPATPVALELRFFNRAGKPGPEPG
jgi:predicted acyl esterase